MIMLAIMNHGASTYIANDNIPAHIRPEGDAAGFRAMLREQELERRLQALERENSLQATHSIQEQKRTELSAKFTPGIAAASCLTLFSGLTAGYFYSAGQHPAILASTLVIMVWAALTTSYLSSKDESLIVNGGQNISVIAELALVIATIAGLGIWGLVARDWALTFSLTDSIAAFSALSLMSAVILRSYFGVLLSTSCGLVWVAMHSLMPTPNVISAWAFPILALTQLFIASNQGSKFTASVAIVGLHGWLFWILNERLMTGVISPLQAAAFLTLIGMAHYRLGKAASDSDWGASTFHIVTGWSVAVAGAIGLQHYWLGKDDAIWNTLATSAHPLNEPSWQIIGGGCIALVGIAGVIRMKHNKVSGLAVLLSLGVAVAAAILFDQRHVIGDFIQAELNMPAKPLVGMLIGASILASAAAMCMNGLRHEGALMLVTGLTAVAIECAMLFNPALWTLETSLVFAMWFVCSLSLAILFAAKNDMGQSHV